MTITVRMTPEMLRDPVSTRVIHEMWLALTAEGFTVRELTNRLAVAVDVEAPSEEIARKLVADAYGAALPAG